jgi:hypothetical protein
MKTSKISLVREDNNVIMRYPDLECPQDRNKDAVEAKRTTIRYLGN